MSVPGVSKLAYGVGAGAAGLEAARFVEPATGHAIDRHWLESHPYGLMGSDTAIEDTGLFVPYIDAPQRMPGAVSHLSRYQKARRLNTTGPEEVLYKGRVPARSVVVPGTRTKRFPAGDYQLPCALIIGKRSEKTDEKTSLNEVLREFALAV